MREFQFTAWVCTDCTLAHANGLTDEELGNPEPAPWELLEEGTEVTMGLLWEAHECPTPEESFRDGEDCGCDRQDFSWSPCDGCGSQLGGERHAFTFWYDRVSHADSEGK